MCMQNGLAKGEGFSWNEFVICFCNRAFRSKDRLGSLIAIRHPMIGNEDLSMNVGNNLAINTAVIQMQASVDELIEATGKH